MPTKMLKNCVEKVTQKRRVFMLKLTNKDAEFYSFMRSLNAYKAAFSNKGDIMLIEPDSQFFKYLKQKKVN